MDQSNRRECSSIGRLPRGCEEYPFSPLRGKNLRQARRVVGCCCALLISSVCLSGVTDGSNISLSVSALETKVDEAQRGAVFLLKRLTLFQRLARPEAAQRSSVTSHDHLGATTPRVASAESMALGEKLERSKVKRVDRLDALTTKEAVKGTAEKLNAQTQPSSIRSQQQRDVFDSAAGDRNKRSLDRYGTERPQTQIPSTDWEDTLDEQQALTGPGDNSEEAVVLGPQNAQRPPHTHVGNIARSLSLWQRVPTSLLEGSHPNKDDRRDLVSFEVCGTGMYIKAREVDAAESVTCWQACHFAHEKYYDICASKVNPRRCFREKRALDEDIPATYLTHCKFIAISPCPLFSRTVPTTDWCIREGISQWQSTGNWNRFTLQAPAGCAYAKWTVYAPVALKTEAVFKGRGPTRRNRLRMFLRKAEDCGVMFSEIPAASTNTIRKNSWYSRHRPTASFEKFYVIARDRGFLSVNSPSDVYDNESSIVPAKYWDALPASEKGDWEVLQTFQAPSGHTEAFKPLTSDTASAAATEVCLFKHIGRGTPSAYGMRPGTQTCEGKIGILRVAAMSQVSATASVDRESGFDLCVARRWIEDVHEEEGFVVRAAIERQRVLLESGCATALSPLAHSTHLPQMEGEWELHFLALRYPHFLDPQNATEGSCPWAPAVQYGLKCFAFLDVDSEPYATTFAEAQRACRQAGVHAGIPSHVFRLALLENDHDFYLLSLLSRPESPTWVGFYQKDQKLFARITPSAELYRIRENPCDFEKIGISSQSARMSALVSACKKQGAQIDTPPWATTWDGINSNVQPAKRWDISWCRGHPLVTENGMYVDCAALKVDKQGTGCIVSAPCEAVHDVVCTFPVYYGLPVTHTDDNAGPLRLTPRIRCTRASCVVRFKLASKPGARLPTTESLWGVPGEGEAFVALKSSCTSPREQMIGPYVLKSVVQLHNLEHFRELPTGVYELCYCSAAQGHSPRDGRRCIVAANFRHLVAAVYLENSEERLVLKHSVHFPSTADLPTPFVIDYTSEPGPPPAVVDCMPELKEPPSSRCRFFIKYKSPSPPDAVPEEVVIRFVPIRRVEGLSDSCAGLAEAKMSVVIPSKTAIVVPVTEIRALFYVVCDDNDDPLGVLFYRSTTAPPSLLERAQSRARHASQVFRRSFLSSTPTGVLINIPKQPSWDTADAATVFFVRSSGPDDDTCDLEAVEGDPGREAYPVVHFTKTKAFTLEVDLQSSYKKVCLRLQETRKRGSRVVEEYFSVGVLPPHPIPILASESKDSCFAVPQDARCEVTIKGKPTESPGQVVGEDSSLRHSVRLILVPTGTDCPSKPSSEYGGSGPDKNSPQKVTEAEWIPLATKEGETKEGVTFYLPTEYKPWLAEKGIANVCWQSTDALKCTSGLNCAGHIGRLFWVGVISGKEEDIVQCAQQDPSTCLIHVKGFNLERFSTTPSRLAAVSDCGVSTVTVCAKPVASLRSAGHSKVFVKKRNDGIGLLRPLEASETGVPSSLSTTSDNTGGEASSAGSRTLAVGTSRLRHLQHNEWDANMTLDAIIPNGSKSRTAKPTLIAEIGFGEKSPTGLAARSVPKGITQSLPSKRNARSDIPLSTGRSLVKLHEALTRDDQQDNQSFTSTQDLVTTDAGDQPVRRSTLSNLSTLSFVADYRVASNVLALCFQGAERSTQSLETYTVRVGSLLFAQRLKSAEIHVKLESSPPTLVYNVCIGTRDLPAMPSSNMLIYSKSIGNLSAPTCGCQTIQQNQSDASSSVPIDVRVEEGQKVMEFELLSAAHPVLICWCYRTELKSQSQWIYTDQLLGYVYGGAPPTRPPDEPIVCSLEKNAPTCRLRVSATLPMEISSSEKTLVQTQAHLPISAKLYLLGGLDRGCHENFEESMRQDASSTIAPGAPVALRLLPTWLPSLEQTFEIGAAGQNLIRHFGDAVACYTGSYCGPNPEGEGCAHFVGTARWIGPLQRASKAVLCDRLVSRGCRFSIQGKNMDLVDTSVPRVALMSSCATGTLLGVAASISRSQMRENEQSGALLDDKSPLGSVDTNSHSANTSLDFVIDVQPAQWGSLCWNPRNSGGAPNGAVHSASADSTSFTEKLGILVMLPLPYVEAKTLSIPRVDEASFTITINAIVPPEELSNSQPGSSSVRRAEHHVYQAVEDGKYCSQADTQLTELHHYSVDHQRLPISERIHLEAAQLGLTVPADADGAEGWVQTARLHYKVDPRDVLGKLCWLSTFYTPEGTVIHRYSRKLGTVPAASSPVLVADNDSGIVYCNGAEAPEDCAVTLRLSDPLEGGQAFLPRGAHVFLLSEQEPCPSSLDTAKSHSRGTELVVDPNRVTTEEITYRCPSDGTDRLQAGGVATLCWYSSPTASTFGSGKNLGASKLGNVVWRGPLGNLQVVCADSTGCSVLTVRGRGLADMSHDRSRLALLRKCGEEGGLGPLTVMSYPQGYKPSSADLGHKYPSLPSEEKSAREFRLHGRYRADLVCSEGYSVSVAAGLFYLSGTTNPDEFTNVRDQLFQHCWEKAVCIFYVDILDGSRSPNIPVPLEGTRLVLKHPSEDKEKRTTLQGAYVCQPVDESRTPFPLPASSTPGQDAISEQTMQFRVRPAKPDVFRLCWNPRGEVHGAPAEYTVDLGFVRYVPIAGLTEVRAEIQGRVDRALVEVTVLTGIFAVDERTTFVYLKPANEKECRKIDQVPEDERFELSFIEVPSNETRVTVKYWFQAPAEEMTLCFEPGALSADRLTLGEVPGAVNPKKFDPEVVFCSSAGDPPCELTFFPMKIADAYPDLVTEHSNIQGFEGAESTYYYEEMASFFQEQYSVYLVMDSCVEALRSEPFSGDRVPPQDSARKLPDLEILADRVVAVLTLEDKSWLAARGRAYVCWKNEGSCSFEPADGRKSCVAEVGIIVWTGPLRRGGQSEGFTARCAVGVPCTIRVPGVRLTADSARNKVAVLEACGGVVGPGIAEPKSAKARTGTSFAAVSQAGAVPSSAPADDLHTQGLNTRQQSLQPDKSSLPIYGQPGLALKTHTGSEQEGLPARTQRRSGLDIVSSEMHAESVLEVEITLSEAEDYKICWNPSGQDSRALHHFTLPIGTVEHYGFSRTTAFCVSGSRCTLSIPSSGFEDMVPQVAIKTTDCSDDTIADEFGPDDLSYVDTTCPGETCSLVLPITTFHGATSGLLFLGNRATQEQDCASATPKFSVAYERDGNTMRAFFKKQDFIDATASDEGVVEALLCWQMKSSSSAERSNAGSQQAYFEDAALLGVVRFGGPQQLRRRGSDMSIIYGPSFTVDLRAKGATWAEGQTSDFEQAGVDIPPHWKRILLAEPGRCGNSVVPPLAALSLLSMKERTQQEDELVLIYGQPQRVRTLPENVAGLDVCWCASTASCTADKDYSDVVAQVQVRGVLKPLEVVCSYDTRCPFEYVLTPQEVASEYPISLSARPVGCKGVASELPASGELVRTPSDPSRASETESSAGGTGRGVSFSFQARVSSNIFERTVETESSYRTYSLCRCGGISSACAETDRLEVGRMRIYDTWLGVMTMTLSNTRVLPPPAPFDGKGGVMYAVLGSHTFPCQQAKPAAANSVTQEFIVDFSALGDTAAPGSKGSIFYCERQLAEDCTKAGAPLVCIADILLKGPTQRNWRAKCRLGSPCNMKVSVFNAKLTESIAVLKECGASNVHDYGIRTGVQVTNGADGFDSAIFQWPKNFEPDVPASQALCWCIASPDVNCSNPTHFTVNVGQVEFVGLAGGQNRACHVGSICKAENLTGYSLQGEINLRVMAHECGAYGSAITDLPQEGVFTLTAATEKLASFSLPQPLFALAKPSAHLCECPGTKSSCSAPDDYTRHVGQYTFAGPAGPTQILETYTGAPLSVPLQAVGELDPAQDFFIVTKVEACQLSGADSGKVRYWPLQLGKGDALSWDVLDLPGDAYFICYCHNMPNSQTNTCEGPSFYRTWVGLIIVTGPSGTQEGTKCETGYKCSIETQFAGTGGQKSESVLQEGVVEVHAASQKPCGNERLVATAKLDSWRYGVSTPVQGANQDLKEVVAVYTIDTVLLPKVGTYNLCWRPSRTTTDYRFHLGKVTVAGPAIVIEPHVVVSGAPFEVQVEFPEWDETTNLEEMHLRLFHDGRELASEGYNCGEARSNAEINSPMYSYMPTDGRPREVTQKNPRKVIWDAILVLDATTPEGRAGDWFSGCICDGTISDCSSSSSYTIHVANIRVAGVYKSNNLYLSLGREVSYKIFGELIPTNNAITFLPAKGGSTPAKCGNKKREINFYQVTTTRDNESRIIFSNLNPSWAADTILMCWCGGPNCFKAEDFRTQVSTLETKLPAFQSGLVLPGGRFEIKLRGVGLRSADRITVVSPTMECGVQGTERMNSTLVKAPSSSTVSALDNLGTARVLGIEVSPDGKKVPHWRSWPIQLTNDATHAVNVCYCSSAERECHGAGTFNVLVGTITIGGPSADKLEVIPLEEGHYKIQFMGSFLKSQDAVQVFTSSGTGSTSAQERCNKGGEQSLGMRIGPEWTAADGTEQWYRVSLSRGRRYSICWSPSTRNFMVGNLSPDESRVPDEETLTASPDNDLLDQGDHVGEAQQWYYIGDTYTPGIPSGQTLSVVVGHPGTVLIKGLLNSSDVYTGYVGDLLEDRSCVSIRADPFLLLQDTVAQTTTYIIFEHPRIDMEGRYKTCLYNINTDVYFEVGYIYVGRYFSKTAIEVLGTDRLIMFPCSTHHATGLFGEGVTNIVWLPDGITAWIALARSAEENADHNSTILRVSKEPTTRHLNPRVTGLRAVVACAVDETNSVYFLGPYGLSKVNANVDVLTDLRPEKVYGHSLGTPIDLTVKSPFVFISGYSSHLILAVNTAQRNNSWTLIPSMPGLLFSAGIEHVDFNEGVTALFVADTLNHIVGRLNLDIPSMETGAPNSVLQMRWTSVFGIPKRELQGERGLSYPFTLGRYQPWTGDWEDSQKVQRTLIVVGELRSTRMVLLNVENNQIQMYREIDVGEGTRVLTGFQILTTSIILTERPFTAESELSLELSSVLSSFPINAKIHKTYFNYPTFPVQLQSAVKYSFVPSVIGLKVAYFKEDVAQSNLAAVGMHLDTKTGEISGTWRGTGAFKVVVTAVDLLGGAVWSIEGEAACQAGEYYNENESVCQSCPVGTFRDQERELQLCETHKPHSSTASVGSTLVSQCRCLPGFETDELGYCQPCPAGTYKNRLCDSKCEGRCPTHMNSTVEGAETEEALQCVCIAGYYLEEGICRACPVGFVCAGVEEPPTKCAPFSTTRTTANKTPADCMCVPGYTREDGDCVKCGRLTYKSFIGDEPCTSCPQPGGHQRASYAVLSSTDPDLVTYTAEEGATQLRDCGLCASGYYFERGHERCSTCAKDSYCPGLNQQSVECGKNSVTLGVGAETPFDCRCPKGYGRIVEPDRLDYTIACGACPKNTFQHVDGSGTQCLPCPPSTHTEHTQSTSLFSCLVVPGYFATTELEEQLSTYMLRQLDDDESPGDASELPLPSINDTVITVNDIRRAESKYDVMDAVELKALPHGCAGGTPPMSFLPPATKVQTHAQRLEDCFLECARNVYCTHLSYFHEEAEPPPYITSTSNYTGVFFQYYWPCTLYLFGELPSSEELASMDLSLKDAENLQGAITCALQRPFSDNLWRRITFAECPRTSYCPGGTDAKMFECTLSAFTLAQQAARVDQCVCIPGFQLEGLRCVPCPIGTYKDTLSKNTCTTCPAAMTTAAIGSTSADDCACTPGLWMGTAEGKPVGQAGLTDFASRACFPCLENMYCPGLWEDPPFNTTHTPPQECPTGASVPPSTLNADSSSKCLCRPGYSYTSPSEFDRPDFAQCNKCAPGSYKELQENSPCAGRCMKDAQTLEGAVSKKQCFCKYRKYAVLRPGGNETIVCHECIRGAVCPGGFKEHVQQAIEVDPTFSDITIDDHQIPFPDSGFFAVYDEDAVSLWNPEAVPSGSSFMEYLGKDDAAVEVLAPKMARSSGTPPSGPGLEDVAGRLRILGKNHREFPQGSGLVHKKFETPVVPDGHSFYQLRDGAPFRTSSYRESTRRDTSFTQMGDVSEEQRIPHIHPCIVDRRCKGGPSNLCEKGAGGFLCAACLKGYCVDGFGRSCAKCLPYWWADLLFFFGTRIVLCVLAWLIATVSVLGACYPIYTQAVLLRTLISNFFFFSVFGIIPETSELALRKWGPLYRALFLVPFVSAHMYIKMWCLADSWGMQITYVQAWYLQRYVQICVPLLDALLCIVGGSIALKLYSVLALKKIQKVIAVLKAARALRPNDSVTEATIRRIECDRCFGLLRYLSTSTQGCAWFKRLIVDLIPAFTVLWVWHYPVFVLECMQLVFCIETKFKSGKSMRLLSSMPVQKCDVTDPWFLSGVIVGGCGLLLGGVGSITAVLLWATSSVDSEPVEKRLRHAFLTNGYSVNHRGWEAVLLLRKALVASSVVIQFHPSSAGAQEMFRNSVNLGISVMYIILLLALEPYDRRSYSVFTRVEFLGLLSSVISGLIFQGSYYHVIFSYFGLVPIVAVAAFYIYAFWNLLIECGRNVIMLPHLARGPSTWRYYHRVTRLLARLFTAQQAKIYYNHLTKDLVLEAEVKSRLFRLRKKSSSRSELLYQKIKYEYRTYFVVALSDALAQVVISWRAFSIPGDWLDFTVRYAFCYCFWQRHCAPRSFRVPLDMEEFESLKPSVLSCWNEASAGTEATVDALMVDEDFPCSQAEEDLLQLMLDDDVYDDSPITLGELYTGVEAMRRLPQGQLLLLHCRYRKRLEAETDSMIPQLKKENEELEKEILCIQEEMKTMYGGEDASLATPFVLDFFLTVEMVQQARLQLETVQQQLTQEVEAATRSRVAKAVAQHLALEMQQEAEMEHIVEETRPERDEWAQKRRRLEYMKSPSRRTLGPHAEQPGTEEQPGRTVVTILKIDAQSSERPSLCGRRITPLSTTADRRLRLAGSQRLAGSHLSRRRLAISGASRPMV